MGDKKLTRQEDGGVESGGVGNGAHGQSGTMVNAGEGDSGVDVDPKTNIRTASL